MADGPDRAVMMGQMVDAVCYMAMSMRTTPSLHRAVQFAARNVGEPMASRLRRLIVDVELRKFDSLEDAFIDLARTYDPGNEEFQEALRSLRTAELQATEEGVERALERATSTVFEGARRRVREFADGLSRPVFVLFSLGVVLPLMVGSMLPLMSVGGLDAVPWVAVLVMDVAFPLVFLVAARRILARRPLIRLPNQVGVHPSGTRRRAVAAVAVAVALICLGVLCGRSASDASDAKVELDTALADGSLARMDGLRRSELEARAAAPDTEALAGLASAVGYLPVLWGLSAAVAVYYLPALRRPRRRREEVRAIEDGLPDALFQIGSRVAGGMALEPAIQRTASAMPDEPVSSVLRRALSHITLKRTSATEALFGREGALAGFPSENVSASLKTVVEMVRKDQTGAGRAIVAVSDHLRDLRRVDREVSSRLRPVTEMMRSTATLFAPVILGITTALYLVVARLAPSLPLSSGTIVATPMPAAAFSLVLGGFVLAIAAATMYFTSRLAYGEDPIEGRYQVARALPVAAAVFTIASLAGQALIV
jgi:Flp pilus assembly protein TadB